MDDQTLRFCGACIPLASVLLAFAAMHLWKTYRVRTAVAVYILFALFTNAYCQTCRYDEWFRNETTSDLDLRETRSGVRVMFATVGWPVYWTTTGFMYLLEDEPQQENACACGNCG